LAQGIDLCQELRRLVPAFLLPRSQRRAASLPDSSVSIDLALAEISAGSAAD